MAAQLINISPFYPGIGHHIYAFTPPNALLRFSLVSRAFNQELSDEFFRKKCEPYLSTLKIAPWFYDPLIQTVQNPWKLMCFCLTEEVPLDCQERIVQRVANNCQEKFKAYLTSMRLGPLESALLRRQERMQAICGAYYQDPNSQIHQAWRIFKENWTEEEERTLDSLQHQREEDRVFQDWSNNTKKLVKDFAAAEKRNQFQKIGTTEEESFFQENPAIEKQIDEISDPKRVMEVIFPQVVAALQDSEADPRAIQVFCLERKKSNAVISYQALESERLDLDWEIRAKDQEIAIYRKVIDNPELFKKYTKEIMGAIVHHLFLGTLTASIWECVAQGNRPQLSQKQALVIQKKINFLPQKFSALIWQQLYWGCANGIDEWEWSEKHFHEYSSDLDRVVGLVLPSSTERTKNPVLNFCMLRELIQDKLPPSSS